MAKIAVECGCDTGLAASGIVASDLHSRMIAKGADWAVEDIVCTAGPRDRRFEELHSHTAVGLVLSGTFQYQVAGPSCGSGVLMTPGSLLLGNAGQSFECGHEHATGDRCLAFRYSQDYFERIAADSGAPDGERGFRIPRIPPMRHLSQLIAMACATLSDRTLNAASGDLVWEEIAIRLAAEALAIANGLAPHFPSVQPSTLARVTRVVRRIERDLSSPLSLRSLAQEARLSPYHFLGVFQQVTGLTPHKYLRRARLRNAGIQLRSKGRARVLDIALDCGFGDISSFNRAFQREFGTNPLGFRREAARSSYLRFTKRVKLVPLGG